MRDRPANASPTGEGSPDPSWTLEEVASITGGEWLVPPPPGAQLRNIVDDSRTLERGDLFLAIRGTLADGHCFLAAAVEQGASAVCVEQQPDAAVRSAAQGASCALLSVSDTLSAYHALAAAHRQRMSGCCVIGLTGSAGKTSVKEMLAAICREAAPAAAVLATQGNTNNHFGVPRNLLRLRSHHRFAILELGSNQPGDIASLTRMLQPDVALVTMIGRAHMEKLGSLEGVAREKADILRYLNPGGTAVIPVAGAGEAILKQAAQGYAIRTFSQERDPPAGTGYPRQVKLAAHKKLRPGGQSYNVSQEGDASVSVYYEGWSGDQFSFRLCWQDQPEHPQRIHWSIGGAHQARNAAAAAAAADALGIPRNRIARGLQTACLPGMRGRIERRNGVLWFNDAYNANPESMRAGLALFADIAERESASPLVLVLGDMLELGPHAAAAHRQLLVDARQQFSEAILITVGPLMRAAAETETVAVDFCAKTAEEAGETLAPQLQPGAAVFLKGSRSMELERVESC